MKGVEIVVVGGRKMPKMDSGVLARLLRAKCDPYLVLSLGGAQKKTSKVCKRTLAPTWNETFAFEFAGERCREVLVECFDHDVVGAHDFIGSTKIVLNEDNLVSSSPQSEWFKLINPDNKSLSAEVFLTVLPVFFPR